MRPGTHQNLVVGTAFSNKANGITVNILEYPCEDQIDWIKLSSQTPIVLLASLPEDMPLGECVAELTIADDA